MKKTFCLLLFLLSSSSAFCDESEAIQIHAERDGQEIRLLAQNNDPHLLRWIQVQLPSYQNLNPDRALPARALLAPQSSSTILILNIQDPNQGISYRTLTSQGYGNPDALTNSATLYLLPYAHGTKHEITQGYLGKITHQGLYALDFDLAEGTTICAARDGVVAEVKEDSDTGGMSNAFASKGNHIEILHDDGSSATYAHLELHGALVQVGDRVKAGQAIGLSGATGEASGPHLHFSVQKPQWDGTPLTYPTLFLLGPQESAYLKEGGFYYSWHPGGPSFQRFFASNVDLAALKTKQSPVHGGKVHIRQQQLDNVEFLFLDNPLSTPIRATLSLDEEQDVQVSSSLPVVETVPAMTEVFVMAITMGPSSRYETQVSYQPLP